MKYTFFTILIMFLAIFNVSAATYTSDTDLFDGTYSNRLLDMAYNQIDNFVNQKYIIVTNNNNYYLITGKDYSINGNTINFNNSTIIKAIRYQQNYSYYYEYSISNELSTQVTSSYLTLSNINFSSSVSSSRFNDYQYHKYMVNIGIFVIGLLFAVFLSKERRL